MYDLFVKVLSFFSAFLMLFLSPGGHIGTSVHDKSCPEFFGEPAEVNELAPIEVPQHPYLAAEGTNGMHGNSYNTGSYNYMGPLGINPVVTSRSMNVFGGLVATLTFDSKGRINTPSVVGGNWNWRIDSYCINDWLSKIIADLTTLYGRDN